MFTINGPQHKILGSLSRFGAMTIPQIAAACFTGTDTKYTYKQVRELDKTGILWRKRMAEETQSGGHPLLCGLTWRGGTFVQKHFELPGRPRTLSEAEIRRRLVALHDLTINDVLIAAMRERSLGLQSWWHEFELKQLLTTAVPDGILHFPDDQVILEVDESGKEHEPVWKAKVRALIDAYDTFPGYREDVAMVFAVVVRKSDRRRDQLQRWTAEAAPDWTQAFLFTSAAPGPGFFTTNHWYHPGDPTPRRIFAP